MLTEIDKKRIEEISQREKNATPGPWYTYKDNYFEKKKIGTDDWVEIWSEKDISGRFVVTPVSCQRTTGGETEFHCGVRIFPNNKEFIVHSRDDIPFLLDTVKSLEETIKDREEQILRIRTHETATAHKLEQMQTPEQRHGFKVKADEVWFD